MIANKRVGYMDVRKTAKGNLDEKMDRQTKSEMDRNRDDFIAENEQY